MKILIVEDERRVANHVDMALLEQGHTNIICDSGAKARAMMLAELPDLIILDLGLPDMDGLDLLREWRCAGIQQPVLILSARDAVEDRIKGLDIGADDYLPKPFSIDELLARVRSLHRRQATTLPQVLSRKGIVMNLLSRSVTKDGESVILSSREFGLLELFLQNPGRVLTRSFIAEKVWQVTYDMQTNLIEVYIRKLRQKLEGPGEPQLIRTLRGSGYIMD